jgi:hypothetical protein
MYTYWLQPQLLSIFEKYYLKLGPDLKPAMRGLVIALLPVVEEEGSEYFDKVGCIKGFMCNGMVLSGSKWSVH